MYKYIYLTIYLFSYVCIYIYILHVRLDLVAYCCGTATGVNTAEPAW